MGAMSGESFLDAQRDANPSDTPATWTISASSVVMMIASSPETFDKDQIVEALQTLGFRLPIELLAAGAMNAIMIKSQFENGDINGLDLPGDGDLTL